MYQSLQGQITILRFYVVVFFHLYWSLLCLFFPPLAKALFVGGNFFILRIPWYGKINQIQNWKFCNYSAKIIEFCTLSHMDSLPFLIPRQGWTNVCGPNSNLSWFCCRRFINLVLLPLMTHIMQQRLTWKQILQQFSARQKEAIYKKLYWYKASCKYTYVSYYL